MSIPVVLLSLWVLLLDETLLVYGSETLNEPKEVRVGQVLNLKSHVGDMADACIDMAVDDFYATHPNYKTKITLVERHSEDAITAASAVLDLLEVEKVSAIIGPQSSQEAAFAMELGKQAQVPMIAFSVTSPSLSSEKNPYFVRAAQNDSYQVQALTMIFKGFNWEEVILIYEESVYGNAIIPYIKDAFQEANIQITYKASFPKLAKYSEIEAEVNKMRKMPTRVFLVHMMSTSLASRLFEIAKNSSMMNEGYAWLITDGLSNSLDDLETLVIDYMEGVLGIKPYIAPSNKVHDFNERWKKYFPSNKPNSSVLEINIFGLWAYDMVWALAEALEKVGPANVGTRLTSFTLKSNETKHGELDLTNLGISQIGPALLKEISNIKLSSALSGDFHLVNGQLKPSSLEIFNIIGDAQRTIGYWNPTTGISRSPRPSYPKHRLPQYSTSMANLKKIIWPGDSLVKPASRGTPPTTRRMRIGVVEKSGFPKLVKLERGSSDIFEYTGYSIEVFKSVVSSLPEVVKFEYEFISFPSQDIQQLTYQLLNQTVDAVVGDTRILRTAGAAVDFSLPYSESGMSMVVPMETRRSRGIWIFAFPFSMPMWSMTVTAYAIIAAVVWLLEWLKEKGGVEAPPPPEDLKLSEILSWPAIAVMYRIIKRRDLGSRSMLVLKLWQLLTFIIVPVYIAHLHSIFVSESQGLSVDIGGDEFHIGYQSGSSSVKDLLITELNKKESQLKAYATPEQYHVALSKGSSKGGVSAIVDENPFIKLFLAKYCSKYVIDGPSFNSDGLAFAFPSGSPLAVEISKAILNVKRSGRMKEIEQSYFRPNKSSCDEGMSSASPSSRTYRLPLTDFSAVFLITGCLTFLIICSSVLDYAANIRELWVRFKNWTLMLLSKLLPFPIEKDE